MATKITPVQNLVSSDMYYCKCPYQMTAEAITVHNTANDASARNEISYMIRNTNYCSFHFAVDDKEVVQGIPLDRNSFNAGDGATGYGNRKTIAIEICYSKSGGTQFDKAEKLAAQFIAQLLMERGWSTDRVGTHQMRSGKYCPHRTLDNGWQRFINMIEDYMKPAKTVIDWRDVKETTGTIISSPLIDLTTGKTVKTLAGSFTYVQVTADGKYARTAYSRDNGIDNGVLLSDIRVESEPEPSEVKWVDVVPFMTVIQGSVDLINVNTKEVISRLSGEFVVVQVTSDNKYARTSYSKEKGLDNGVLLERLTIPEDKEDSPEPEVKEDNCGETQDITLTRDNVNWLVNLLQSIIDFFKGLLNKA